MTMNWQISVSVVAERPATDDEFAAITEQLEPYAAAVGAVPGVEASVSVILAIEARTLRAAVDNALRLVVGTVSGAGVPGAGAVQVSGVTFAEAQRRITSPVVPELVGMTELGALLGVTKQRANQLTAEHESFPAPVLALASGRLWLRAAVEAWGATWERKRTGRPRKSAQNTSARVAPRQP
jgi:hypothetical protein